MGYQKLTEEEVKLRFITPAIEEAGWDKHSQIRMEYHFTDGEMLIRGNKAVRGKPKFADYLLFYESNIPLAIVEAKDNNHSIGDGMQQAIDYAEILDVPFVYSSNGSGFLEHDMKNATEKEISLNEFPSPNDLWSRYLNEEEITPEEEKIITQPYHYDPFTKKTPRYYQRIAINKTIEAIAKGKDRILLVMATGTGKTFTAFQIAHRLKEAGVKKKILYLADRNILIDQTMDGDFKPFEKVMTKVEKRELDSSYELFFALYQQLVKPNQEKQPYEYLDPSFFDLIIVDECHRGSAAEDSEWREILEYFSSATQIGMTATPKETKYVSNINYFGEPLYTYSLKEGIQDGFLAPYKVIRIAFDKDLEGYRPKKGQKDSRGELVEDRIYNLTDFDKNIILEERTKGVAKRITEFLKKTDRFSKTIVFCVDTEHADRMRQALINENSDLYKENSKYIMRITGNDEEGKKQLDYFIDENSRYPTIVTTSKLLTTGVDCKTCKVIALDTNIGSMTEFKQIIGRGTRLRPEYDKNYFTILDFRNNSRNFADPDFMGEPDGDEYVGPKDPIPREKPIESVVKKPKPKIKDVKVQKVFEQYQCFDSEGNLITENIIDYSHDKLLEDFPNLETFLNKWNSSMKKQAIIDELYEHGIFLDVLREISGKEDMDDFDLICHIAFDKKPLTRQERANNVRKRDYLSKYEGVARKVLEGLLDKYASSGIVNLEDTNILYNEPFRQYGEPRNIAEKYFGGKNGLLDAMSDLQRELYV
ncbi:EcoAI/FtnUII family type I restriction enzme subunit R [uncultured Methanobrevibacter sp.]|uniref:EcoAI/FtnUII family type I restriction enzme subunit R n=1 Tax=uncultured Methanobrevibacter sp. TaxID=253161 RepID=UPI0025DEC4F0|nr:DEAD/DEAH box helicase family protein [uncultured Methanobrevibacter sp.]